MHQRTPDTIGLILLCLLLILHQPVRAQDLHGHFQAIASLPDRSLGTAGKEHTAAYVESIFTALPESLKAVTGRQVFTTPVRTFHSARISIDNQELAIHPLYANAIAPESVPEEGLRGQLVYGGKGRLQDLDGQPVAGSIVLLDMDSGTNWLHAANLGARAILYLDHEDLTAPRLRFRDKEELTPLDFPRFWTTARTFTARFGPPETIHGQNALVEGRTEWTNIASDNIYCFIPGQDPELGKEILLVEAFLDGSRYVPDHAPAADEATSIATLLHLAAGYATQPPQRSVLLLATSGRANNLLGLREAIWALSHQPHDLATELDRLSKRVEIAQITRALLDQELLGADDSEQNTLLHQAIQAEIRNEIEKVNADLRRARLHEEDKTERIRKLAEYKLLLRRLSWEGDYRNTGLEGQEVVRAMLPTVLLRAQQVASDLEQRVQNLQSSLKLLELTASRSIVAAVSLHLSSHGDGVGSVGNGWMYQLKPDINRARQYTFIRPILSRAAEGHEVAHIDLLAGASQQLWFNYFPDQPALGGEITALAGMPGFTLATLNDMRSTWGTPFDTLDQIDMTKAQAQAELVQDMLRALDQAPLPAPPYRARNGFATLSGRANFLRQGELFAEQTADNALLQVYQDQQYTMAWVDSLGEFRIPGLADRKHSFGKAIIEGYRFESGDNRAVWAIDKNATGLNRYRVRINRQQVETDLIMFGCTQTTFFQLREVRNLNPLTRINLIDARTETEPLRYWFSRIDTRISTLCTLFLEPETPIKVTLSDSILQRKLLLLNNSSEDMLGNGFPASTTPAIHNTSLQAAQDMMYLVTPRVENLEEHSIINQRIRILLERGQEHLRQALEAQANLLYSEADYHAKASLAAIVRVYNDVEGTQKDVLAGVLFYIALFIPFTYCLERLLFAYVSIHKRIVAFLGLLVVVIAIIYAVHPAFQLTYSPLVVVLAFFILGLSVLVSLILFTRFEQEMKNLQRRAQFTQDQAISLWGAFVAAFSIGVTNLRRRKVRTALTCITLIILTYTLLNFTSVRHSLDQGAVRYQDTASYQGLMLKALEWKSLPRNLGAELSRSLPADTLLTRRVWWETPDRTRPPAIVITADGRETIAAGLIGLDPQEASISARNHTLIEGSWIDTGKPHQVLLSQFLAAQLGIKSLASSPEVRIWGIPFTVQGIFHGAAYTEILDLDGEPLTTVIYPNEVSSELSEAEAEAAESGQDIASMASRYQHIDGDQTIIIPASTLLQLGGSLKSLAMIPQPDISHADLSARLADRYQVLIFHGDDTGTWLHYSTSALSYSGMGNVLIPSFIAILIVLNTMVSSVVERKKEISVYISVGLAPPHVSSLFVAEAMAFGIISAVTGYLGAQVAAHFLADTTLWAGMTANYSSLAGVAAMLIVMAVVLLSVVYPSQVASRIAIPDVNRSWKLPEPQGSTLVVTLPFLIKQHEQDCAGGFLADYYLAHEDITHGLFSTDQLNVEYACPVDPPVLDHPACFYISFRAWLAPFDFGVRQQTSIFSCPSPDYPGFLELRISLTRETGEKNAWMRLCRSFLNDLRKQLLIWRSLDTSEKHRFEQSMLARIDHQRTAEVPL